MASHHNAHNLWFDANAYSQQYEGQMASPQHPFSSLTQSPSLTANINPPRSFPVSHTVDFTPHRRLYTMPESPRGNYGVQSRAAGNAVTHFGDGYVHSAPPAASHAPPLTVPSQSAACGANTPLAPSQPTTTDKLHEPAQTPSKPNKRDDKENKSPAASPVKATRRKGRGSKASKNSRRDGGESDVEIAKLPASKLKEAKLKTPKKEPGTKSTGLTDIDKIALVQYVTDSVRWKDFKLKQAGHWADLADTVFEGRYTVEQLTNYWNTNAWAKYKAVRELDEHTGGGDGDVDRIEAPSDESADEGDKKPTNKRKKPRANVSGPAFTIAQLDKFRDSEIYELIHKAAYDDVSIVRARHVNSSDPISDSDASSESDVSPVKGRPAKRSRLAADSSLDSLARTDKLLESAVETIKKKAEATAAVQQAQLELARKREEREQATAKKQEQREELESIQRMCESSSNKIAELGMKHLEEFTKIHGI